MKFDKHQLLLYAITPNGLETDILLEQLRLALLGGVTMVQLREKGLCEDDFFMKAVAVRKLCERFRVPLIINDNVEIALKSGADGVHLGADDTPVALVRNRTPKNFIIGATAKTVAAAKSAQRDGADYLGVGAVFPSPTKQSAIRISTAQLREICASVTIPAVAIGGICASNLETLSGSGISGIAVVSAIFGAADIRQMSNALFEQALNLI